MALLQGSINRHMKPSVGTGSAAVGPAPNKTDVAARLKEIYTEASPYWFNVTDIFYALKVIKQVTRAPDSMRWLTCSRYRTGLESSWLVKAPGFVICICFALMRSHLIFHHTRIRYRLHSLLGPGTLWLNGAFTIAVLLCIDAACRYNARERLAGVS